MRNTGMLFANDANKDRVKAVVSNVHRMGITNTIISNQDGRKFAAVRLTFIFIFRLSFLFRNWFKVTFY